MDDDVPKRWFCFREDPDRRGYLVDSFSSDGEGVEWCLVHIVPGAAHMCRVDELEELGPPAFTREDLAKADAAMDELEREFD